MVCRICNETLADGQANVSTTTGDAVHVACADSLAQTTYSRSRLEALGHLIVIVLVAGASFATVRPAPSLLLLLVALGVLVAYGALHRRYFAVALGRMRVRTIVGRHGRGAP